MHSKVEIESKKASRIFYGWLVVAAGFAEFQPLDTASTEDAYKKNRRIELKLTER